MSRWFRLYDEMLDDPKVQRLPPDLFKAWVNLLCLANRNGGCLPGVEDIAFALRVDDDRATEIVTRLIELGLLDPQTDGELCPHNWNSRQFKSDGDPTAAERQARKRLRDASVTVTDQSRVTSRSPDTETDTEADKVSAPARAPKPKASLIPENWEVSEAGLEYATEQGMDLNTAVEQQHKFRDHHRAKGNKFLDHEAAWRTWVRNWQEWKARPPPSQSYRPQSGFRG